MNPILRAAVPADLAGLRILVEGAYRGDSARRGWTHEADLLDGQRTDEAALAQILADPSQRLLAAELDGRLVGCVLVAHRGGAMGYLGMLTVDPERQGGGLGRRLVRAAEAEARVRYGATRMEMTVIRQRAELIAWYERLGYVRTGEQRPFPADQPRFGLPRRDDLVFEVLERGFDGQEADAPAAAISGGAAFIS